MKIIIAIYAFMFVFALGVVTLADHLDAQDRQACRPKCLPNEGKMDRNTSSCICDLTKLVK